MPYALCFLLFMIGLYCAVVKKNMVKIAIGLKVGASLFLVVLTLSIFRSGGPGPEQE